MLPIAIPQTNDKVGTAFKIIIGLIIVFVLWQVVKVVINILKPIQRLTESSEDVEERQDIPASKSLSPMFFLKYFKRESEIRKYLDSNGLSYSAINTIADNLWNNGFGKIYDNEEYIYQQLRILPSWVAISMLSYNLKKRYGMGLDELIDRNLSANEKGIILKIINKKPLK